MKRVFGVVGFAALCATMGCSGEMDSTASADEADLGKVESALVVGIHHVIYAFNQGSWRRSDYAWPDTTNPTVTTGSFGASDDIPFLWTATSGSFPRIGSYGTSGARLGYFYFDINNNMMWDNDLPPLKFRSDAAIGDKPFVLVAPAWRRVNGICTATNTTGPLVGIKRGTTVYLDRDGDRVWGAANHCDLSGTIGNAGDNPIAIPNMAQNSWDLVLGLTRVSGSNVTWYYDNNRDLIWNEPPDWSSPVNAFGDASQSFPVTSPGCIATKVTNGTTVLHDVDCNGVWEATDSTYPAAVPSAAWKLAGMGRYYQQP